MPADRIRLRGLRMHGHHGVLAAERELGQPFIVDVDLEVDTSLAARTDDIADTVDYGGLAHRLAGIVAGEPTALLETLAWRLADACLADERVVAVAVTVHKPAAPVPLPIADIAVTVHRGGRARPVVLALGSNVGNRLAQLRRGRDMLAADPRVREVRGSRVFETDPVGGPDQGPYLNAVLVARSALGPRELLALAHAAEEAAGRVRDMRWGPRTLDVDLISYGDLTVSDDTLTLPHPRAAERAFVLAPWHDVDPDAVLPGRGRVVDLLGWVGLAGIRRTEDAL
ncbi:MAG: 2-amino-4-hydroxy-6-hydroxymethyldihydropteridine diphosphokinase [Frankiaceae bacterium]